MQCLGNGLKDLKDQVRKLEAEVEKLKATGPVNAGDVVEKVDKSPGSNDDDDDEMMMTA